MAIRKGARSAKRFGKRSLRTQKAKGQRILNRAKWLGTTLQVGRIRQGPAALPPGLKKGGMARSRKACKC